MVSGEGLKWWQNINSSTTFLDGHARELEICQLGINQLYQEVSRDFGRKKGQPLWE